ncbi:hypothetical protein [Paenibacillus ginsengarvi]|uniref:Phage tail tape measure protein n=1 Tax=Paenibacillus ginsengarvi TaxID=400777 RepID=A0A3B0CS18_9BACL|nr:hypothetical protein [Paenibacillus ginsengarvi]RKN86741.1 hypothetical protein D7M11_01935 [Paenibacillus ginsengarvi]
MGVVKNLMIRIGADFSDAKKGMQGATAELEKFKRSTTRTTAAISGKSGIGGITSEFKSFSSSLASSFSRIRGAKGLGGVVSELKGLGSSMRGASVGIKGLSGEALGAARSFGVAGVAVGAFTAVVGVATVGLYKASQTAVKFEADIGRLNKQLQGGSRDFMQWARGMGLAKSTAAELGATYSVLLSSFIKDNTQLNASTKDLVQATRVVASNTSRSIEDVLERMRSGLLGNTEAIEDLGVFVNVSMIESTKAFKKFANGKSWDQLDFRLQQQIRLAAILEQSYERYGSTLQNNVMTKQGALTEQLKDIKLNLSQAFLPIWDAVLPALTKLATAVAGITEDIARFMFALRKMDYDAATKGSDKQTDAVKDQGNAYDDLGKSAKKARGELAAFDQLNLLGKPDGGSGGGTGGSGGLPGGSNPSSGNPGDEFKFPQIPPFLNKKYRIEFDPPQPPDAGAGGVAIAVDNTVNGLVADTNKKFSGMWDGLKARTLLGVGEQLAAWNNLSGSLAGMVVPSMTAAIVLNWNAMWEGLKGGAATNIPVIVADWQRMLSDMLKDLASHRISITAEWGLIGDAVQSIKNPLALMNEAWHGALDYMQSQLNAYQPYISWGIYLISQSLSDLQVNIATTASIWDLAWSDMLESLKLRAQPILSLVDVISSAWSTMTAKLMQPITMPNIKFPKIEMPNLDLPSIDLSPAFGAVKDALTPNSTSEKPGRNLPGIGYLLQGLDAMSGAVEDSGIGALLRAVAVPGASFGGVGAAAGGAAAKGGVWFEKLREMFQGLGASVPAFATGAVVYGPTLAMVGDNHGAATDPEIIAPLSDLENIMGNGQGNNRDVVSALQRVEQAVRELKYVQAVISQREAGGAAIREIQDHIRRTGQAPFNV